MPVKMYQFGLCPHFAAEETNHGPMFDANVIGIGSPFSTFGEPVEIRKASTVPVQRHSDVHNTDEEFMIRLELRHYQPDEVTVMSDDQQVTITAKHEMIHNTDGCVSQAVTNVYNLPEDVDPRSLTAAMNTQGILIIRGTRSTVKTTRTL